MIYKGIETENVWNNGSWYTHFMIDGEIIKTVQWSGSFGEEEIKKVISREILPYI